MKSKTFRGMTLAEWAKEAAIAVVIVTALSGIIWLCALADQTLRY